ncbi:hypothetical protein G5I_09163 [Acromyrmex echinatior]|uniref:Uncharacterized protein n=1 Tax=Acromyrmex echinatior TaxID=103372 RepID=F4WTG5_ACREC|nr:hypothetical protein G5I_09163 [Acromyrmex echinatior]
MKTVLIDGNRLGMFNVPGSKAWLGMIRPRQEALNIPGPVTEDLTILWQGCTPCTPGCKRRRAVKCVRPVGRGEQDLDVIEDSYCQGPKPRESASCEASRRRREDSKRGGKLFSARSSTATRQNDLIRACKVPAKTALNGAIVKDRHPGDLSTCTGHSSKRSYFTGTGYVNALPNEAMTLISANAIRNSIKTRRDRSKTDKKSGNASNGKANMSANKIKKGEVVIDKEDIRNLTLTIILERDEKNVITNFPKDFEPRPSQNSTEFTLVGMDALRYIQRIQEEARASPEVSIFRERRACDTR